MNFCGFFFTHRRRYERRGDRRPGNSASPSRHRCFSRYTCPSSQLWLVVMIPLINRRRSFFIVSTTSVNLTWTPAQQLKGDEVEFWSIQYKLSTEADYRNHVEDAPGRKWSHEVEGLKPGQQYLFRCVKPIDFECLSVLVYCLVIIPDGI